MAGNLSAGGRGHTVRNSNAATLFTPETLANSERAKLDYIRSGRGAAPEMARHNALRLVLRQAPPICTY